MSRSRLLWEPIHIRYFGVLIFSSRRLLGQGIEKVDGAPASAPPRYRARLPSWSVLVIERASCLGEHSLVNGRHDGKYNDTAGSFLAFEDGERNKMEDSGGPTFSKACAGR